MELTKIEQLLENYFEGTTSSADEKVLRDYFTSTNVAQHLKHYQSLFGYFETAKQEQFVAKVPLKTKNQSIKWLSIAASVTILASVLFYVNQKPETQVVVSEYGTYENPEEALKATKQALAMVSGHVNSGIESMNYMNEFQSTKKIIFK